MLYVKHPYKRVGYRKKKIVDFSRAGHDNSVGIFFSVLEQIFTKLWPIKEFVSFVVSNHTYQEI